MSEPIRVLVLAGPSKWRRTVLPKDVRVGWRITCQDGSRYDMFWGSARPERVDALIAEVQAKQGPVEIVDLRERPDDVRDRLWFAATQQNGAPNV